MDIDNTNGDEEGSFVVVHTLKLKKRSTMYQSHSPSSAFQDLLERDKFRLLDLDSDDNHLDMYDEATELWTKIQEIDPLDRNYQIDLDGGKKNETQHDYLVERFHFVAKYVFERFGIQTTKVDIANSIQRPLNSRISDILVEELRLDIEVKKKTLRLLKRERLESAEPWKNLYAEEQQGFFQFHERSKRFFDENPDITPQYFYGILTDSVNIYFLVVSNEEGSTMYHLSSPYSLLHNDEGNVAIPDQMPIGFMRLMQFISLIKEHSIHLKGAGFKKDTIYFDDHDELKIQNEIYKFQSVLGKNSKTVVYSAKSEKGAKVCIKVSNKKAIENEINILETLRGIEGVPKVLNQVAVSDSKSAMVIDVLGTSVISMRDNLSDSELESIFLRAGTILNRIHERQVVHCDVKPEHVILSDKDVYLIDFGGSFAVDEDKYPEIFTPMYASPNVLVWGRKPEPQDDLFSLFYSFYATKTGHLPWERSKIDACDLFYDLRHSQKEGLKEMQQDEIDFYTKLRRIKGNPNVKIQPSYLAAKRIYQHKHKFSRTV
eukprot:TRINITY_DN1528_c0_g1_i12.p1 TRINITY_DN1528_c0_g1~~TRINITY_DN1528_c0_g1_i12.p1  ORF type:complete len:545 (+),score=114.17 TRINITY_DN1528_c0_g1_i12:255-1889(+)